MKLEIGLSPHQSIQDFYHVDEGKSVCLLMQNYLMYYLITSMFFCIFVYLFHILYIFHLFLIYVNPDTHSHIQVFTYTSVK